MFTSNESHNILNIYVFFTEMCHRASDNMKKTQTTKMFC